MVPTSPDKSLKIRLDSKDIVFRRAHRDGQKQIIQGDVTFYTQSPTTIKSVKVILKGTRKVSWLTDTLQPQYVHQKETVLRQEQKLHVYVKNAAQASRAEPGLYTWPFAFTLSADVPESVPMVPHDSYIYYTVTAEIATGLFSRAVTTTESLQIIKSPSYWIDDLHFAPELRVITFFDDFTCLVTLPQPYQPSDGDLSLDFKLTPHHPDAPPTTTITSIKLELFQVIQLVVKKSGEAWRTHKETRSITSVTKKPSEIPAFIDTGRTNRADADECDDDDPATVSFSIPLPLPLAPYSSVQSVNDEKLKVRYLLRATIFAEDAASGDKSEQSVYLFPKLFVPIRHASTRPASFTSSIGTGNGSVVGGDERSDRRVDSCCSCSAAGSTTTLPVYGEHVFDTLYSGELGEFRTDDVWDVVEAG